MHEFAVLVLDARHVGAHVADVRDHDPDVAHVDDGLRHQLDRGEQPVDVIRALDQDLQLAATTAARGQETFRVLEVVVVGGDIARVLADRRRDDLALGQRRAVVHGDDAEHVVRAADDDRGEALALADDLRHALEDAFLGALERQVEEPLLGDHHELCEVHGVCALAQDLALRAALAAGLEERRRVLKVPGDHVGRQRLRWWQQLAITREHVADAALWNGDQWLDVHDVLERHQEVQATAQDVRLEARFARERDDTRFERALSAHPLLDDADLVVGNEARAQQREQHREHAEDLEDQESTEESLEHGILPRAEVKEEDCFARGRPWPRKR